MREVGEHFSHGVDNCKGRIGQITGILVAERLAQTDRKCFLNLRCGAQACTIGHSWAWRHRRAAAAESGGNETGSCRICYQAW